MGSTKTLGKAGAINLVSHLGWKLRRADTLHQLSRTDDRLTQKGPPVKAGL